MSLLLLFNAGTIAPPAPRIIRGGGGWVSYPENLRPPAKPIVSYAAPARKRWAIGKVIWAEAAPSVRYAMGAERGWAVGSATVRAQIRIVPAPASSNKSALAPSVSIAPNPDEDLLITQLASL